MTMIVKPFSAFCMGRSKSLVCVAAAALSACGARTIDDGDRILSKAGDVGAALDLSYAVLANKGDGGCALPDGRTSDDAACYEARITLGANQIIDLNNLTIYFSQTDPVGAVSGNGIVIRHVNGDLHTLSFQGGTPLLNPGEPRSVDFWVKGLNLTEAKMMPNYYVVDSRGDAAVIDSTREGARAGSGRKDLPHVVMPDLESGQYRRSTRDATPLATAKLLFERNEDVELIPGAVDAGIIPQPISVQALSNHERLSLTKGLAYSFAGAEPAMFETAIARLERFGAAASDDGAPVDIRIDADAGVVSEGYRMRISSGGVGVVASDIPGAYYALQSLAALITPGQDSVPAVAIDDAPRFAFRGMHLDVARNFHSKETVIRLLDQMAAYKLNKLHLHLADDEGWRVEIAGLPELTEIGGKRCHDPDETTCLLPQLGSGPFADTAGSGYFSRDGYKDILQAAAARQIEVIPSLDMPGHARAAVKSMEARHRRLSAEGRHEEAERFLLSDPDDKTAYLSIQYYKDNTINVCRESAYRFVEYVLDDLIRLHEEAGAPLKRYHVGADETAGAWRDSPICKAFLANNAAGATRIEDLGGHFIERVADIVTSKGLTPAAWSDGLSEVNPEAMPENVQSNAWGVLASRGAQTAHAHANNGWQVVISLPDALYFDFPYEAHPKEGGYYWAAREVSTRKIFSMMPENLPAHAYYWRDRDNHPLRIDDRNAEPCEQDFCTGPRKTGVRFFGVQGHLWTETVRDQETLEYQVFPRLLALAERAWRRAAWEIPYDEDGALYDGRETQLDDDAQRAITADWNRFASILVGKELAKLDASGVGFRLPPPGADFRNGVLQVNSTLPGLSVEVWNGEAWQSYHGTNAISGDNVEAIARTAYAGRVSRALTVDTDDPDSRK